MCQHWHPQADRTLGTQFCCCSSSLLFLALPQENFTDRVEELIQDPAGNPAKLQRHVTDTWSIFWTCCAGYLTETPIYPDSCPVSNFSDFVFPAKISLQWKPMVLSCRSTYFKTRGTHILVGFQLWSGAKVTGDTELLYLQLQPRRLWLGSFLARPMEHQLSLSWSPTALGLPVGTMRDRVKQYCQALSNPTRANQRKQEGFSIQVTKAHWISLLALALGWKDGVFKLGVAGLSPWQGFLMSQISGSVVSEETGLHCRASARQIPADLHQEGASP